MHSLSLLEEIYKEEEISHDADSEFLLECICNSKEVCLTKLK